MSIEQQSHTTLNTPHHIRLAHTLSEAEQIKTAALLHLLPADVIEDIQLNDDSMVEKITTPTSSTTIKSIIVKSMVDGRGMACPMPLLKTKVALRDVNVGESLYVVATDPNSQADIKVFCQQTQQMTGTDALLLMVNQTTQSLSDHDESAHSPDTIYHFIITKTDSN